MLKRHGINILQQLKSRGFIQQITREERLHAAIVSQPQTVYVGIDPTAGSLHAGHLFPLLGLFRFKLAGNHIIPLIGGATGLVGDPSGRLTERALADPIQVERNVSQLSESVTKFFESALRFAHRRQLANHVLSNEVKIVSNLEWHKDMSLLDFLRIVGTQARVNTMLNRESVQSRMSTNQGISYTEFTYQLLQAYDFYYLHSQHGCTIQMGGSDQWGNILAGIDLIGRLGGHGEGAEAYGITTPLLTRASGAKFGKSAGNAVWLDENLTSPFAFYQFFLKSADADVGKYLNLFTLLPEERIEDVMARHKLNPEKREAQRLLADEVTEMIHGESGVTAARAATRCLFETDHSNLKASDVIASLKNDPRLVTINDDTLFSTPLIKLASTHKLTNSASAARSLVQMKGLYLNNQPIQDIQTRIQPPDLIGGRIAVLRAGKDKHLVLVKEAGAEC